MSALDVRHLCVRFATPGGLIHAVEDVGFAIEPGETFALVGESGSGKSATALAVMGLLQRPPARIDTGEVWLGEQNLLALPERELRKLRGNQIAMVFQDPSSALHPLYTIGAQLSEVLELHRGTPRREARKLCARALGDVGIADPERRLDAYPHELSGGTQQRAMLAMALLCEPKVLIADEPTTALDVTIQAQILDLLKRMQHAHGTAIMLISHDLALVASVADRVAVMYAGALVESAAASELFAQPTHPYTLGLLACAPSLASELGTPLRSIPGAPPNLAKLPSGCTFHPRCAFKVARCESERPPLAVWNGAAPRSGATGRLVVLTGRRTACFEADRAAAEGAAWSARAGGTR
jgi:oligopeptide/dipeptide ABC transporter ATP-binding protein